MLEVDQKLASLPLENAEDNTKSVLGMKNINVHFNVITSNSGEGFISDADIRAQISVLNAAYAAPGFNFILKTIKRVTNSAWFSASYGSPEEIEMKTTLRKGNSGVLNLYSTAQTDGTLGWATFPIDFAAHSNMDGVVLDYGTLPNGYAAPYNLGDTATHEVFNFKRAPLHTDILRCRIYQHQLFFLFFFQHIKHHE
jgi:hypothetical protein